MGAKQTAQSIAVWTNDSAVVLLDGIEANEHGKRLAEARLEVSASSSRRKESPFDGLREAPPENI